MCPFGNPQQDNVGQGCVVVATTDLGVRNPLIWQEVCRGVSRARRRGSLELAGTGSLLWDSVSRAVAEADRRALTSLDFPPAR